MKPNEMILAYLNANLNKPMRDSKNVGPVAIALDGVLLAAQKGSLIAEFVVREDQLNHANVLHGGVITTMLDEIMGMTLITEEISNLYVTINLSVDFLYGAKLGEKVKVVSEVIRVGKKVANIEGKMYNEEGKLLAKASSNFAATSIPFTV
ncbi:MAG: hypothetical protein RIR51_1438 [Bacteroidota bacterium]|jgi:uncharacterized protein (TIGR00369 family)